MTISDLDRQAIIDRINTEVRPLCYVDKSGGGYDCCGCSTYEAIVDHCIRVVSSTVGGVTA